MDSSLWCYKQTFLTLRLIKLQLSRTFSLHEASREGDSDMGQQRVDNVMKIDMQEHTHTRVHIHINKGSRGSNKYIVILEILLDTKTKRIRFL